MLHSTVKCSTNWGYSYRRPDTEGELEVVNQEPIRGSEEFRCGDRIEGDLNWTHGGLSFVLADVAGVEVACHLLVGGDRVGGGGLVLMLYLRTRRSEGSLRTALNVRRPVLLGKFRRVATSHLRLLQ
jgi:acyl-coenzyme A thioesterase PaaI-like protein